MLFGWFDRRHRRLGRNFPGVKIRSRLAAIVLIGTFASGCASNAPDARALQDQLVAVGVGPAAAKCLIHAMRVKFDDSRLGAREEPTAAELEAQRVLLHECEVKVRKAA